MAHSGERVKGQCVESIFKKLEENNILYVLVRSCTDRLQRLNLSINKPAKDHMKRRFQEWFSNTIREQLEAKVHEEVDMRLSVGIIIILLCIDFGRVQ